MKTDLRETLLALLCVWELPLLCAERNQEWKTVYASFTSPHVADSAWTVVDSFALRLPDFSVHLYSGEVVALRAQTGITGWLFEGEGLVRFAPRLRLEQQQLRRFTDDTVLVCQVRRLLVRSAAARPLAQGVPASRRHSLSAETLQFDEHVQSRLLLRRGYNLSARLLADYLAATESDFVLCAFWPWSPNDYSPPLYIYSFDPWEREAVRFCQSYEHRIGTPFNTVCSYGLRDTYHAPSDSILPKAPYLTKYDGWVEARPAQAQDLRVDMGFDIFLDHQPLPVLQMDINREFVVQSICDENGDTLAFIQEPGEAAITIVSPAPQPDDTLRLLVSYAGRSLKAGAAGDYYLSDPIYWLPRLGYLRRAVHKIVVRYPKGKRIVAVGKASAPWNDSSHASTYLNADTPAKAYAFAFGPFVSDSLQASDFLRLRIFSTPKHSAATRRTVLEAVHASLRFFQDRLTPYALQYIDIMEVPGAESQALPGLVMLSEASFGPNSKDVMEMLRAHEVAHQWFGNMVGWATYHDQWLAEGIAEYLGAAFMQVARNRSEYFNWRLAAWRDDIIAEQRGSARGDLQRFGAAPLSVAKSEGRAAGPVWMGIRLAEKHGIDYYVQTYEKGAWVIHMLRRLLTDDATGSDAGFWNLLADFCATFAQRDPSTFDLQKIVERYLGTPMEWFFQQWILGTDIPSYEWNASVKKFGKNDFIVAGIVRQSGTSPNFRMPVPIAFEFDKNARRVERVWVTGQQTAFSYHLTKKPKRIVFNDGMAVLCTVQKKGMPIPNMAFKLEIESH